MSEVAERGKKFYEEHLKSILEPQENGKFVAIEPESENYFVGATAVEAVKKGQEVFPKKIFFMVRIGFPYRIRGCNKEIALGQRLN
jgi:hypothetical protein